MSSIEVQHVTPGEPLEILNSPRERLALASVEPRRGATARSGSTSGATARAIM